MSDIARRDDVTSQVPPAPPPEAVASLAPALPWLGRPRPRLWPGAVIVALLWAALTVPGWIAPGSLMAFQLTFWAPMVAAGLFLLWWVLFSRAPWLDRIAIPLACAAVGFIAISLCEPNPTVRLYAVLLYGLPWAMTAWVGWLLLTPFLGWSVRRAVLPVLFVLAWGWLPLVRVEGVDGALNATLAWRWSDTAEDLFLANPPPKADSPAEAPTFRPGDWPGFRGPKRDGRLTGVRIATDWKQRPPRELWRHRVGPGWSSVAVIGDRLYTQEQRGKNEAVVCYLAGSGAQVWEHTDEARFREAAAGPGPRATPTFHDGKLYALGATGRLNCLDAATGEVLWWRDIVADSGASVPPWGFASSPLVAEGVVSVVACAPDHKAVLGYDAATGDLAWAAGDGQHSYSSPHLLDEPHCDRQLLIATDAGLTALAPKTGRVLWRHDWPLERGMARVVQPAVLEASGLVIDVVIGSGFGNGTRRLRVGWAGDGYGMEERWTSRAISPYFNDLVTHDGHLYGFDGVFFTCVSLEDGEGKWRERGYGNGQVLLLADQGLLLVLSEKGAVALVQASPEGHKPLGKFQALKGKTWNHPVVAHGKLFVRNGEEMACYELAGAD
jgi:outer membrane protein assembly factor BamB